MSHTAQALVLRCIDFRFVSGLHDQLGSLGLKDQHDLVSVAGAAKNLVDPMKPADTEFVMRQIDIANRLHHIKEVIIINHLDCGAYGKIFASPEEERQRHERDLKAARDLITTTYPNLKVRLILAGLHHEEGVKIERVGHIEEV